MSESQQSLPQQAAPPLEVNYRPLDSGFRGEVIIHIAESLNHIFGQIVSDEAYAAVTEVEEILNGLFQKTKAPETAPAVGTCVAAIYTEKDGFYRARVTAVDGNQLTLDYIDFGFTGQVELFQIRALSKEMSGIPCSTYRLNLCLTRRPDDVPVDVIKTLLDSLVGQICTILVHKYTDGLIEGTLTKDGQLVNSLLSNATATCQSSYELVPPDGVDPVLVELMRGIKQDPHWERFVGWDVAKEGKLPPPYDEVLKDLVEKDAQLHPGGVTEEMFNKDMEEMKKKNEERNEKIAKGMEKREKEFYENKKERLNQPDDGDMK